MAINLRGVGVVADGSITNAKLADNSVSAAKIQTDAVIDTKIAANAVTNTKIATDAVTDTKIATNAVTNIKIAADAVTTVKIANDAVSTDKVTADIGIQHFLGYESELTNTGTTLTSVAEFNFTKDSTNAIENWKSLGWAVSLKSDNVSNTAEVQIFVDGVSYDAETTTSTAYIFGGNDSLNISALSDGLHLVEIKLDNDNIAGITTINKLDVYLGKKSV